MKKSPDAFRTISEVAEWLDVPTHVLRFWESRFSQVKPVKRAGGRRYYRPTDMQLIGGIKVLLHDEGMTIRGVQKLLREEGVKHVAGFSQPLDSETPEMIDIAARELPEEAEGESDVIAILREAEAAEPEAVSKPAPPAEADAAEEKSQVLSFGSVRDPAPELPLDPPPAKSEEVAEPAPEPEAAPEPEPAAAVIPPTPDVPATDPADNAPAHAQEAGPVAKLIARNRSLPPPDGVKIEEVVAALRAVRDRSAS